MERLYWAKASVWSVGLRFWRRIHSYVREKERICPLKKQRKRHLPRPSTTSTKLLQQPAVITGCSQLDFLPVFQPIQCFCVFATDASGGPDGVRMNSGLSLARFWAPSRRRHFNSVYGDGATLGSLIMSPALTTLISISFSATFPLRLSQLVLVLSLCQTPLLHELALQRWKWEVWWSLWAVHLCLFSSLLHGSSRKSATVSLEGFSVLLLQIWGKTVVWRKKPQSPVTLGKATRKHRWMKWDKAWKAETCREQPGVTCKVWMLDSKWDRHTTNSFFFPFLETYNTLQ